MKEVRETIYRGVYQEFKETRVITHDDGEQETKVKTDVFKKKELYQKVIVNEKAVIVFLDDGTKGRAKCDPEDDFELTKGIKIAFARARIKQFKKELKELTGKKY